jgi:stearoyl-CoA desaturase (delta-9 desaturase)
VLSGAQHNRIVFVTDTRESSPEQQVDYDDIIYPQAVPFVLAHLACFAAIWTGVTWQAAALGIGLYWLRMFAIGAGYHRYFSHRSYKTGRVFQFVLACLAQSTAQKSVLWWAAKHRHHHLFSDLPNDVHSPRHAGFFYSHVGWIFAKRHDGTDLVKIEDFARYPELMWLHRFEVAPAVVLAVICFLVAGWPGLVVGFFWSTVAVYHGTFCINSLAHVHGTKRYVTGDDSRNNWLLALMTMGEGWHNNHHAYQSSVRQGFRWWEVDPTYYILLGLSKLGIVWDLKSPPEAVLKNEHKLGSRVVNKAAADVVATFNVEQIAQRINATLASLPHAADLRARLADAQHRAADVLASLPSAHLPTREDVSAAATRILARTPSIDEVIDRAHQLLLEKVSRRIVQAA